MKTLVERIEESRNWARRYITVMGETDLTKLTAEEFRGQKVLTLEMWEEALRRLERLEQCEAALKAERDRCELLAQYAGALGLARKIRNGKAAHAALEE